MTDNELREDIRHKLSAILMDTDESKPITCDITIGEAEAIGLSTLELPKVIKAFQMPSEGIIYFLIEGCDDYMEFDDFATEDLLEILTNLNGL